MKRTSFFIISSLLLLASCAGDSYRDHVRRGNRNYEAATDTLCQDSSFIYEACTEYDRAIQKDSLEAIAHYNKANAYLVSGGKDSTAFSEYMKADSLESDFTRQAHIHRNIGVMLQNQALNAPDSTKNSMLQGAIENYKASLRYDPKNDETRYNLALCQWQLKKNQQDNQGGGGGGQGENKDEEQKQDQQQQDQQQQQQQEQQQQQQQASEQMIQAAMQRERETQNRMNRYEQNKRQEEAQQQDVPRKLQKNW